MFNMILRVDRFARARSSVSMARARRRIEQLRRFAKARGGYPKELGEAFNAEFRRAALEAHNQLPEDQRQAHGPALDKFNGIDHFGSLYKAAKGDADLASDAATAMIWGRSSNEKGRLFNGYDPGKGDLTNRFYSLGKHLVMPDKPKEVPFSSVPQADPESGMEDKITERPDLDRARAVRAAAYRDRKPQQLKPPEARTKSANASVVSRQAKAVKEYADLKQKYEDHIASLPVGAKKPSIAEVSRRLGVSNTRLWKALNYKPESASPNRLVSPVGQSEAAGKRRAELGRRYKELVEQHGPHSAKAAAKKLGVPPNTLTIALRYLGVKTTPGADSKPGPKPRK